jgi:cysteine desulfurase family protein
MIYLDNAATSWPKPPEVLRAMAEFLERAGGNPGRSGHRLSIAAGRMVYDAREAVADLFNVPDPLCVIFTQNATHAINLVLQGLLRRGDRVVTTGIEHNVVMRLLRALERTEVQVTIVPCRPDGTLEPAKMRRALGTGMHLVVVNHASNVTGTLAPLAEIARMVQENTFLLVDAAQTAGVVPIDMPALGIDFLAFTGHKGLLGPSGTGGLILGDRVDTRLLRPLMAGGTGSRSESEEQPEDLPDKFESGTPTGAGIAGLSAGIRWVQAGSVEAIRAHEVALTRQLLEGLSSLPRVTLYGPSDASRRTAVVSFTIRNRRVSEIGLRLDEEYGILSRVGLHCAPAAHRTIGTFPEGTVRLAPGVFTSSDDIDTVVRAVERLSEG